MRVSSRVRLVLWHSWPEEDFNENTHGSQRVIITYIQIFMDKMIRIIFTRLLTILRVYNDFQGKGSSLEEFQLSK